MLCLCCLFAVCQRAYSTPKGSGHKNLSGAGTPDASRKRVQRYANFTNHQNFRGTFYEKSTKSPQKRLFTTICLPFESVCRSITMPRVTFCRGLPLMSKYSWETTVALPAPSSTHILYIEGETVFVSSSCVFY